MKLVLLNGDFCYLTDFSSLQEGLLLNGGFCYLIDFGSLRFTVA
jgi:hypothetical protein